MSLSAQVLLGLVLGIATGAFFGEDAARLQFVGDAFIMLLQMTVMPFIAVSLVAALGKLDARSARDLGLKAGTFLLVVWGLILAIVAALPLAFPPMEAASFFSSSLVAEREPFDFLSLYIPANPIYALSHNIVPALVLFSVVLGVAIIPIPGKEGVLRALGVLTQTLTRITGYVARLAPVGVFALISSAAGTIGLADLERLQIYVVLYALLAVVLAFVILPGLVAALTPLRWGEIVPPVRDAIITAFAAGNLLIVIPILTQQATRIAAARASDPERAASAVDVIVPASFNFPSAGKLLSLAFIPFAAWFTGSSIGTAEFPRFLITGLFTFFGATSVAIPVLLDMLRLPHDLFQIFLAVDVITGRFQVMVAAMCTVALALLGAFAMSGSLRVDVMKLLRFAAVSTLSVAVVLLGVRLSYGNLLNLESGSYRAFVEMDLADSDPPVKFDPEEPPVPSVPLQGPRLDRIERDGLLRVCYFKDSLPFAFVNASNRLVGFDVAMAQSLARELTVDVAFTRVERTQLDAHLNGGTCDIAMSGTALTPLRTRKVSLSIPYMTNHLALVVEDHVRNQFDTWEELRARSDLQLVAPPAQHFLALLRRRLPNARITPTVDWRGFFRGADQADAMVLTAEAGSSWTLVYPSFSVVVPEPGRIQVPMVYAMPKGQAELKAVVDTWIMLAKGRGAIDTIFDHWILGRAATEGKPRWSILHDVLLVEPTGQPSSQSEPPTPPTEEPVE